MDESFICRVVQGEHSIVSEERKELNIMVFCSNPVNGGTARIFYEFVMGIKNWLGSNSKVFPCINKDNNVEIYKKISNLTELPVVSAETMFPGMYGGSLPKRLANSAIRNLRYVHVKKQNIRHICDYIREHCIDIVIIHNGGYVGDDLCNQVLEAAYICKGVVKNRTYILHSDMKKSLISKLRFRSYDKKVSREATELVTVSEYTKNRIKASSYITKDIKVIYNGIDVKKKKSQEELDRMICPDRGKHNVLMIGNFLENKGQMQFIDCAVQLYEKNNDYRFTIIGNIYDDDYYKKCTKQIEDKSLRDVFSIHQGVNNASDYIDMFDVQVVPSMYDESFGLISVEAMANGVPIVAFACGGIPEVIVDGQNGFVVPIGDSRMMADRIDYLINHETERIAMGEKCKKDYQSKFSTDSMIQQYVRLLGFKV